MAGRWKKYLEEEPELPPDEADIVVQNVEPGIIFRMTSESEIFLSELKRIYRPPVDPPRHPQGVSLEKQIRNHFARGLRPPNKTD